MKLAPVMTLLAALALSCGDDLPSEVAHRSDAVSASVDAVATECGHHTAMATLGVDEIAALEAEEILYRAGTSKHLRDLLSSVALLYRCTDAESPALERLFAVGLELSHEVTAHNNLVRETSAMNLALPEEWRHREAIVPMLDEMYELLADLDVEVESFQCN
jgi:hypothetical protein